MARKFLRTAVCLACVCAAVSAPSVARPLSDARLPTLASVARLHRAHVLAARPDLATRFGWRGAERRLAPITQASLERDKALLAGLDSDAAAIDRSSLSRADAVALDTLRTRLAAERAPLENGAWRREPSLYLAPGPLAVLDVAQAPHVSPCVRAVRTAYRLKALPEVLRAAEINLRDAREGDGQRAAAEWSAVTDSLSRSLPGYFAACKEPTRQADVIEADTLAIGAMRRFVRFLSTEWPASHGAGR